MSYRSQAESALKSYFAGKVGIPVYSGTSDRIKQMPCVVVSYAGATENPPRTGNMDLTVEVSIQSEVGEDAQPGAMATHDNIVDSIGNAINWSDLQAVNATETHFHIFDIIDQGGIEKDTDGTLLRETFTFTIACALGDF